MILERTKTMKKYYKVVAIDLRKHQAFDADQVLIQWIDFTENVDWVGSTMMLFIIEEGKQNFFFFFTRNRKSIVNLFWFNVISI